jgi:hypothetical protein
MTTWTKNERRSVVALANAIRPSGMMGLLVACVVIGSWAALAHRFHSFASRVPVRGLESASLITSQDGASIPMVLEKSVHLADAIDRSGIRKGIARLRQNRPTTLSELLHVLRVFGRESLVTNPVTGGEVKALEIALDAEKSQVFFQSEPSLFETRTGVRCRVLERGQAYYPGMLVAQKVL